MYVKKHENTIVELRKGGVFNSFGYGDAGLVAAAAAAGAFLLGLQGTQAGDSIGNRDSFLGLHAVRHAAQNFIFKMLVVGRQVDDDIIGSDQAVVGQGKLAV